MLDTTLSFFRRISLVVSIVLFSSLNASQVEGADIALLKSQDLPTYREAVEGIKKVYGED